MNMLRTVTVLALTVGALTLATGCCGFDPCDPFPDPCGCTNPCDPCEPNPCDPCDPCAPGAAGSATAAPAAAPDAAPGGSCAGAGKACG